MSSARQALDSLLDALSAVVSPFDLKVVESEQSEAAAVNVRVISLDRRGRSRRDGSLLDLVLTATVITTGPSSLQATERMLAMLEQDQRFSASSLASQSQPDGSLGFLVTATVSVLLDEPAGQPVTHGLRLDTRLARTMSGMIVNSQGRGISGAYLRPADYPTTVRSDESGHFAFLESTEKATEELVVTVRGTTRSFMVRLDEIPLVVTWQ